MGIGIELELQISLLYHFTIDDGEAGAGSISTVIRLTYRGIAKLLCYKYGLQSPFSSNS